MTLTSQLVCSESIKLQLRVEWQQQQAFEMYAAYLSPHALYGADRQYNQGQAETPEGHRASQQKSHPAAQSAVAPQMLSALSQPQVHWCLQHAQHQLNFLAAGINTC